MSILVITNPLFYLVTTNEILKKALTDSYTECFPKRVVKFNKKKTQEKCVDKRWNN